MKLFDAVVMKEVQPEPVFGEYEYYPAARLNPERQFLALLEAEMHER